MPCGQYSHREKNIPIYTAQKRLSRRFDVSLANLARALHSYWENNFLFRNKKTVKAHPECFAFREE
jgi:hypothetical protein